jgi:ketosteroid isomerase-like protein
MKVLTAIALAKVAAVVLGRLLAALVTAAAISVTATAQDKAKEPKASSKAEKGATTSQAGVEGVKAASKAFYAALGVLDDGTAMSKVWAQRPYVTFIGPRSKAVIVGWDAQKKYWLENNKRFAQRNASITEPQIHVNGNLAWEIGIERGNVKMQDGTASEVANFVTGVYERIDGRWLRVSHHAQPIPK